VSELPVRVPDCFAPEFGQKNARNFGTPRTICFVSFRGGRELPAGCLPVEAKMDRRRHSWDHGGKNGTACSCPTCACLPAHVRTYVHWPGVGEGEYRSSRHPPLTVSPTKLLRYGSKADETEGAVHGLDGLARLVSWRAFPFAICVKVLVFFDLPLYISACTCT